MREKYRVMLQGRYSASQLELYRDELRLLWHPIDDIPERDFDDWQHWRSVRPAATPGEMICNRWLSRSEGGLAVVWESNRRELIPLAADLPAHIAYGCLLMGERLRFCRNPQCGAPYFIRLKRGQKYCSNECAWPAKKESKRKWWHDNRGGESKKAGIVSERAKQ